MFSFLVSFFSSALLTLLVIKQARLHGPALDADFGGVQKVHAHSVARIGGLPIFLAVLISAAISIWRVPAMAGWLLSLLLCASVAFVGGIMEDYTGKVSAVAAPDINHGGGAAGYFLVDARLDRIDMPFGSWPLQHAWLMLPLTVLAVAGIANAVNIIDGFNGLASVVTICMLVSLAYVAAQVGDVFVRGGGADGGRRDRRLPDLELSGGADIPRRRRRLLYRLHAGRAGAAAGDAQSAGIDLVSRHCC